MKIPDRRVRRTRAALVGAFGRLLADHDLSAINVQMICDEADVARSSFYAHFNNKRELVTALLGALEDDLMAGADPGYDGRLAFMPGLLAHIEMRKNGERARSRLLLEPDMLAEFRRFVQRLVSRALAAEAPKQELTVAYYAAGGVLTCIEHWLEGGCRQPTALLARDIENLTSRLCAQ